MRRGLTSLAILLAVGACADRYFSAPPVPPESYEPMSSTGRVAALFAVPPDAAAAPSTSPTLEVEHALTITSCASAPRLCRGPDDAAPIDESYRVAHGTGRALVRTREQARNDLYSEVRSRTSSGQRLDAVTAVLEDAATPGRTEASEAARASVDSGDALAKAALKLLEVVDDKGEVRVDVVHSAGVRGCSVSLDGVRCLVRAPNQPKGRRGR